MNILILSPYAPYPPHGGGTMRIYQLIRGLAARHNVTCLTFVPDAATGAALAPLHALCKVQVVYGPPVRSLVQRARTTLGSKLPDMALRNASLAYAEALQDLLATQHFDVVQAESIEMVGYLFEHQQRKDAKMQRRNRPNSDTSTNTLQLGDSTSLRSYVLEQPGNTPRLIFDTFNVEYLLQKRAALTSLRAVPAARKPGLAIRNIAGGLYSLVQWAKLKAYEKQVLQQCDAIAAVSQDDAKLLKRLAPQAKIGIVPNGVDTSEFSRNQVSQEAALSDEPQIVFSGTLDFRPNIDAVVWFTNKVLPYIRAEIPAAKLVVVGKKPAPILYELANQGLITVTGEVPDARPYIASAAVYVVPMRIGGGVRLKLLEALALEAAVVTTSMGAEGIDGLQHGQHCLIADQPAAFATAVLRLLRAPALGQRLGSAGRQLVVAGYDWAQIVPMMEELYMD